MNYKILINKTNPLASNFVPAGLVTTDDNENNFHEFKDASLKPQVNILVLNHFLAMQSKARDCGLEIIVDSGYRSYDYQQKVWEINVLENGLEETKRSVAIPGCSEHQSGLAIDVAFMRDNTFYGNALENDAEVKWLIDNAYKYGFILRYPQGKEDITGYKFEPWHYRYVGIELATIIKYLDITLEEYYRNKKWIDATYCYNSPKNVTTFQLLAAYLSKKEFLETEFNIFVQEFKDTYPDTVVIDIRDLERYKKELSYLTKAELQEVIDEQLKEFINLYFGKSRYSKIT